MVWTCTEDRISSMMVSSKASKDTGGPGTADQPCPGQCCVSNGSDREYTGEAGEAGRTLSASLPLASRSNGLVAKASAAAGESLEAGSEARKQAAAGESTSRASVSATKAFTLGPRSGSCVSERFVVVATPQERSWNGQRPAA